MRLLAAPALVGLAFLAMLDDLGARLENRYRASQAQPRNRFPPAAIPLILAGIVLCVLFVIVFIQSNDAGNQWMNVPGG